MPEPGGGVDIKNVTPAVSSVVKK